MAGGGLYTAEQRVRRDATPWTLVQGILAPVQFLVFAVSLVLVLRYLDNGTGETAATGSVTEFAAAAAKVRPTRNFASGSESTAACNADASTFDCFSAATNAFSLR